MIIGQAVPVPAAVTMPISTSGWVLVIGVAPVTPTYDAFGLIWL